MKNELAHHGNETHCQNHVVAGLAIVICALLVGCTSTRSISHSGYREEGSSYFGPRPNVSDPGFQYRGELSEFDVLGITRGALTSESDIQNAIASAKRVALRPGSSILLVQSGAMFPDGPMVDELSRHFRVVPFSGVPPVSRRSQSGTYESGYPESYSRSLRLAAARGGNGFIVCYWGILESDNAKIATKAVTWVPVVNWMVPDETEHVRIRLKLALIDVRSGDWVMLSPPVGDDKSPSWSPRRGVADQKLVESLKVKAYQAAAKELVEQYSSIAATW